MSAQVANQLTPPEDVSFVWLLDRLLTIEGAIIIVSALAFSAFVIVLILLFIPATRKVLSESDLRLRLPFGVGIERRASLPSEQQLADAASTAAVEQETLTPSMAKPAPEKPESPVEAPTAEQDDSAVTERDLYIDMHVAAQEHDEEALENVHKKWLELENRKWSDEEITALRAHLRLNMGLNGALDELKRLEAENADWIAPSYHLARFFLDLQSPSEALEHVERGLTRTNTEAGKLRLLLLRADVLQKLSQNEEALTSLYDFANQTQDKKRRANVYDKIADIYETQDDIERMHEALETGLALEPENTDRRFRLAYSYGKTKGSNLLSYYHYKIIVEQDNRYSGALNNYASVLGDFGIKGEQIRLWQGANEFAHPYPAGNLAIALIDAGFFKEARKYLRELPEEHRGESRALEAANHMRKSDKEERCVLEKVDSAARQMHQLTESLLELNQREDICAIEPKNIAGSWTDDEGSKYELSAEDAQFSGELTTFSKIYKITGKKLDALVILKFVETKSYTGFGLLVLGTGDPSARGTWVDVYRDAEEFTARLLLLSKDELKGLRLKEQHNVQELRLSRPT